MNKSNSASKIKMKSFDDLFGTNENLEQANANGGEIREIPLASLHTFRNHPFQIHEDKLEEMVESVRQYGVLVPGIARMRPQGGYEIIAGHTRKAACELAGLDTMPMFIRNLNDDEATIVMVDSNIQREDIFPSEKARAYSMRYYAMKHQGIKGDKGSSLDIMSEETGENAKKIQRYIRLAKLSDELLDFVDRKKIGFIQGVDLSYLNEEQQQWVLDIILDRNIFPNIEQSARLKASCRENMLTQEEVRNIMLPEQVLAKPRKVTFKADRLDDYFDEGYTEEKITEVIINLLDEWKKRGERALPGLTNPIRSDTRVMAISSLSLKRRLTCYRLSAFIRRIGRQEIILPWAAFRAKPLTVSFLNARTPEKCSSALTATPQEAKPVPDWHRTFPARSPSFALSRQGKTGTMFSVSKGTFPAANS